MSRRYLRDKKHIAKKNCAAGNYFNKYFPFKYYSCWISLSIYVPFSLLCLSLSCIFLSVTHLLCISTFNSIPLMRPFNYQIIFMLPSWVMWFYFVVVYIRLKAVFVQPGDYHLLCSYFYFNSFFRIAVFDVHNSTNAPVPYFLCTHLTESEVCVISFDIIDELLPQQVKRKATNCTSLQEKSKAVEYSREWEKTFTNK